MVIQYPGKLDKNRPVYFAIDNIYGGTGSPTSADLKIMNNIVSKLKAAGLNVVRYKMGPATLYGNMQYVYEQNLTNAIIFNVANGVDPANIREVAVNGNDNRGRKTRARGNDAVIGWMWDACDFTREGGTCYNSVRDSETNTGRLYNPLQYCKDNKVYVINQSSDMHRHPENADYTGDKIAQAFLNLFGSETSTTVDTPETTDTTTTPTTVTTTDDTNKVISTKTTTKYYQIPYYNKVFKTATDHNGAFRTFPTLPYQGEYDVTLKFSGDRTHSGTTHSIKIKNYNSKSALGTEKLLRTVVTTKYTDGTSSKVEQGTVPDGTHTKREIVTETYTNGNKTGSSVKYVYSDTILLENPNADSETIITGITDTTTPTIINTGDVNNPFDTVINTNNGVPAVANMQAWGKNFAMVDQTRSYTLTKEQYQKVYDRDSQTMQVNNYQLAKYVAFESTDTQTYNVIERDVWNFVTESVHQWLVRHNGAAWPTTYIIDFPNHRTKCGNEWVTWKGYESNKYGVTGGKCGLYVVGDAQDTNYTCGPTSLSCCSQVLMHYQSETKMAKAAGTNGNGTGPDGIAKAANNNGFKARVVYNNPKSIAIEELKQGHAFVWHISGHYMAFVLRSQYNGSVLVLNSSSGVYNGKYIGWGRLATGWQPESNVTYPYGGHVAVELNWTLSEERKTLLTTFFKSMGGAWQRPSSDETVRRYWSVD